MDIIRFSIEKPVTVIVGVILVVMFGIIGLMAMPYQLSPTVIEPEITVTTFWRGATPYEVEREIIEEQEKVLKGIPGLVEMESQAYDSNGSITLRFAIGTAVDDALLRVSNKLNEVPSYPENVEKPVINATGAAASPVIWMILKTDEDNPRPADTYLTFFENEVRQHIERVPGVADLFIGSGVEKQMHVVVSHDRLAAFGLTVNDVIGVLRGENANVSAGMLGVGHKDFRIRTTGEFKSVADIENTVVRSTGQRRVFVRDVADVSFGYEKRQRVVMHNRRDGIAIGVKPEPGTNILELSDNAYKVVQRLNEEVMKPRKIYLDWVYDQRPYIRGAINLVKQNIFIGGVLAVAVLLIFLRNISSTIVVASALPISVIGTFIFMSGFGRNLNVVSLSGIAFAVGMLVDNAIVVIENIDRHRKLGKSPFDAAYEATREVWGAILASTLTTIAVFLPVVFIEEEAGQLFRDIAIAVSCAVALSLFVSISVIPMFSKQVFSITREKAKKGRSLLTRAGNRLVEGMMALVSLTIRNAATRLATVVALTGVAVLAAYALFPKMEYLPQGNRNLVINIMVPPPGLSYEARKEIGEFLFEQADPYLGQDHDGYPGIKNMFYVGSEQFMLFGATSLHDQRAGELIPLFTRMIYSVPGMFGVSAQAGIFQTRLGRGRTVEVDVSGQRLEEIGRTAFALFGRIKQAIPDAQIRPVPSLEMTFPEVEYVPLRDRLRANGMSSEDLGVNLDVLMDGRDIGDFKEPGEKTIDLILMASEQNLETPEALYGALISTPQGRVVPVSSLSELRRTSGITQLRHLERDRTITLEVTPPFAMPLEQATETIQGIMDVLRAEGAMEGVKVRLAGAADKLSETRDALKWNFLLAALISYLLMAALFGNFIYPLIIMFTVPLAAAGGFVGLRLVNVFIATSPLDVLTMLGFVILIGVVVNNAILIVHQSLNNVRYYGMEYREAVLDATRTRLRPIYMSASTSIFGMLPLVLFPGPGAELYRGIGSVLLGGLAVSTIFTVFVIPSLLMFFIRMEKPGKGEA
ncbi:MAG: efflux RND transporter permease subunit [Thermodesulfovibrionales bacterium]